MIKRGKRMKDFMKIIEPNRNTETQLSFYEQMSQFVEGAEMDTMSKMRAFPVYTTRQVQTRYIERYEIYKLVRNIPGNIFECGVGSGLGLMAFAQFCAIMEPYHYTRKIVGFDTFAGFTEPSQEDLTSKASHLKKGGLNYGSFEELSRSVELYDMNRPIGHMNKVRLVKGDISETLPAYLEEHPSTVIALLYLDIDLYKPTLDTIKLLWDRVPLGGIVAFDEINHEDYPGETIAVMESIGLSNLELRRFDFSTMLSYAIKVK